MASEPARWFFVKTAASNLEYAVPRRMFFDAAETNSYCALRAYGDNHLLRRREKLWQLAQILELS